MKTKKGPGHKKEVNFFSQSKPWWILRKSIFIHIFYLFDSEGGEDEDT